MARPAAPFRIVETAAVEAEVARIRTLSKDELRSLWHQIFRSAPSPALPKDLIGRILTYRIQEQAFGNLDRETLKLLASLARGRSAPRPRRLKLGTILVREYQGQQNAVTVAADGFIWRENTYASLSTIARAITGTAWNGPRFFGLRDDDRAVLRSALRPRGTPNAADDGRSGARAFTKQHPVKDQVGAP